MTSQVFSSLDNQVVREFIHASNDSYLPWEKLRYHPMPEGITPQQAWAGVCLSRLPLMRDLPITAYENDSAFRFCVPPKLQEWLHTIDQRAAGTIRAKARLAFPDDNEAYLFNSLMEEAIASSQLEGAVTTREAAKRLLRAKRRPRDRSERMILNNYRAIQELRKLIKEKLTPALLMHIHEVITEGTFDNPDASGRFRTPEDGEIRVEDSATRRILHTAPSAHQIDWRVDEICEFANTKSKPFIHPVVKAIILHFALGFVHPFVDGNGRTARAIFYWSMLKRGYWLSEYLPISRIFLEGPAKYARAYLYTETDEGDVTYFLHYHLRVIIRAIKELHEYLDRQQDQLRRATAMLKDFPDLNHRQAALLYNAVKHPSRGYTIQQHAGHHGVVKATARKDLLDLESRGLLKKEKHKRQLVFFPVEELVQQLSVSKTGL